MEGAFMASFREYRKLSVECARLARAAPSREAGDSFAAAAKSWLILDRLARAGPENIAERAGRIGIREPSNLDSVRPHFECVLGQR
jgi:hypothetical protein